MANASIESIVMEDLVIDGREMTTGADWGYRVSGLGGAHFGSITIRSVVPHPRNGKNELRQWWLDTGRGKSIRKSNTVSAYDDQGNERTRHFFEFFPTRWDAGDYSPSSSVPPRTGAGVEMELNCSVLAMEASDPSPGISTTMSD